MMTEKQATGKFGEDFAVDYLISNGYNILDTNWRFGQLEIDIVAQKGDFIIFCEVKTRKNANFGSPENFVTPLKQRNIIRAAHHYISAKNISLEARFDIIAITQTKEAPTLNHIESAYAPRWR